MKKLFGMLWLCMSFMVYGQQNNFDRMSETELLATKQAYENKITMLKQRHEEANLCSKTAGYYSIGIRTLYYPCFAVTLHSSRKIRRDAAQARRSAIKGYADKLENINTKLVELYPAFSLEDSSGSSIDQTTNSSHTRSDRSFSISTLPLSAISSTSSIASDDVSTLESAIDAKIKSKIAHELWLQSQRKLDQEQEVAKKKEETQLLQQSKTQHFLVDIAHKAQQTVNQQNKAQESLKLQGKQAIEEDKKQYQVLQADEKAFLKTERSILQSLKDQEQYKKTQVKADFKNVLTELNENARKKAQRKKALRIKLKKEQERLIAKQKQDEEDKLFEKLRVEKIIGEQAERIIHKQKQRHYFHQQVKSVEWSKSIYTMLSQIASENGDIVSSDRKPIPQVSNDLYDKIKLSMQVFGINEEDIIRMNIIEPAIIFSTLKSVNQDLIIERWLNCFKLNSPPSITPEQIDYCKDIFTVIYSKALNVRNILDQFHAKAKKVRCKIEEYRKKTA